MSEYRAKVLSALLVLVGALTFSPGAWAQFTSTLEGTVIDPSGAVVPKATVKVKNSNTGAERIVETTDTGYYRVSSLPAATFTVTVTAAGFKTTVQQDIRLEVAQIKGVNFTLELGAETTQVDVTSAPPPVDTSQASVSGLINENRVANLPLVGRNFMTLVVLTPGVTGLPSGGGQAYAQASGDIFSAEYGVNLNGNGQRAEGNSFLVDSANVNGTPRGGVSNLNPAADTVQEVRISINNYSAEYGRNSSVLVNVATKQGTNDFHGTAGWFHTNNVLQSRNIFQDEVPVFRRNEAAWTIGGPIRKNKTFFFGSMDILRSSFGAGFGASTPTPDFINFMRQNYPNNISTFVMSTFPAQLSPTGIGLRVGDVAQTNCDSLSGGAGTSISTPLGQMPCNFPLTQTGNFAQTLPRNGIQWNARVDHQFNNGNDRIYGNVYRTTRQGVTFNTPSVYPDFTTIQPEYTMYGNLNYTHIFSPTLLNEMSAGATRAWGSAPVGHGEIPLMDVPGINAYGTGFSDGTFIQNNFEWRDVMSYNRGTHNFKFGFRYAKDDAFGGGAKFGQIYTRPQFTFNNLFDFALDDPFTEGNIGFDPATGNNTGFDFRPFFHSLGIFVNDDWKISSKLTLNLGLRWETFFNPGDYDNRYTGIVFQGGNSFSERLANAKMVVKRPLDHTDYNNFAPRLGIAWDPTGKGKMSIRAGAGIFYDRFDGQFFHDASATTPVFGIATASKNDPNGVVPVYGLSSTTEAPWKFPVIPNLQVGVDPKGGLIGVRASSEIYDPNMKTSYAINWSFGIQYAFTNDLSLEAAYIGSGGRKLYMDPDLNRFNGDLFDDRLDRLNTSFGTIQYGGANGTSAYHGGTASVRKRYSRGLDLQVAYTFGKAINTSDSYDVNHMVDVNDTKLIRGRAGFDIRNKVAGSAVYDFPSPSNSGALSKIFGGWQVGAVVILQSGPPFSVFCSQSFQPIRDSAGNIIGNAGCDFNADGFNYDYLGAPSFSADSVNRDRSSFLTGLFKASDFPRPGIGQNGALGRNVFNGPGYANTDLNITKKTKIPWFLGSEGANIEFRAEFFNLFNRVNLQNLGTDAGGSADISSSQFGRSTSSFGARNIQFGLKLVF
jgi:outer membrane receptor protein involved in Fe transport